MEDLFKVGIVLVFIIVQLIAWANRQKTLQQKKRNRQALPEQQPMEKPAEQVLQQDISISSLKDLLLKELKGTSTKTPPAVPLGKRETATAENIQPKALGTTHRTVERVQTLQQRRPKRERVVELGKRDPRERTVEIERQSLRKPKPALPPSARQKLRKTSTRRGRAAQQARFHFSDDPVRNGIIMSELLQPPISKRKGRRAPFA